jgi:hypothetical protein
MRRPKIANICRLNIILDAEEYQSLMNRAHAKISFSMIVRYLISDLLKDHGKFLNIQRELLKKGGERDA